MIICRLCVYICLFILSNCCGIDAQENEERQNQCSGGLGWMYASSSSSSGGGGAAMYTSMNASSACVLAKTPSQCIRAHPACSWCAQEGFSGSRCNIEGQLKIDKCNESLLYTVKSSVTMSSSAADSSSRRFSVTSGEVKIRVGDTVRVPFSVKEPPVYPVDFYYLMDVSFSMKDDLENVKDLGNILVKTLEKLTNAATGDDSLKNSVRLGFGKFVDKVQSPMTQMTPYKLKHPYNNDTDAPFLFKNVVQLTSDVTAFEETLRNETVSGNLDPPEGALDAMLQAVKCQEVIGWRNDSLRLLMIATESTFHYADDGAGLLSGIVKKNDGGCHTNSAGEYTTAEQQDYPSISQVVEAVEQHSITPIFAVKRVYADLYEKISNDYFKGSTSGVLGNDSSNVVSLVEEAYKKISGQQELVSDNPNEEILCPWYTYTLNETAAVAAGGAKGGSIWSDSAWVAAFEQSYAKAVAAAVAAAGGSSATGGSATAAAGGVAAVGGTAGSVSGGINVNGMGINSGGAAAGGLSLLKFDSALVTGLTTKVKVLYDLYLAAGRDKCSLSEATQGVCELGKFDIKTRRFDEKISLTTSVIGAFDCEKDSIPASPICFSNGKYVCGICECNPGWTGPLCSIAIRPPGCGNGSCSGRGVCSNDRCICNPGHRHQKERIFGQYCQCSECPKRAGLVCSKHGIATFHRECDCICECEPGWERHDCSCQKSQDSCIGDDGLICSGRGTCECGRCICDATAGYGGPTCSSCLKNCPTCTSIQDCIQCKFFNTGPQNETCLAYCTQESIDLITAAEKDSITPESAKETGYEMCAALDETDNCKYYFKYKKTYSGTMDIVAEREKRCKPAYSLIIILFIILLVLLIGLILLCCWRCCVYCIDRQEEKNYNLEQLAKATVLPLLPGIAAGTVIEFIKAKYLVRRSAKLAVIPVRRNFFAGKSTLKWKTYAGSFGDDDFEVLNEGEEGTLARKRNIKRVHGASGQTIEMEPLLQSSQSAQENGAGDSYGNGARSQYHNVDETDYDYREYDWGRGELMFQDEDEFASIEIPLVHNFTGREIMFWVELYDQEKGVALGLKRTKVIVIKDEDAGVIGFPKPSCVFKENDMVAVVPVHRTIGMDGKVSVRWFTRDITAIEGKHYQSGSGILEFDDGEVTKHIDIELIPDVIYDDAEKAFNVELEDPKGGATLDLSHCMVTVLCNEECSVLQFAKTAYPFMENCGIAEIPVMRTRSTKGTCAVRWRTEDDTAFAGKDYEASQGTLTFANAVTEAYIQVPIIDNNDYDEHGRSFTIRLYEPSENTKLAQEIATISIIEDDEPGVFEFAKNNVVLRKTSPGPLVSYIPLVRSLGTDGNITIPWKIQCTQQLPSDIATLTGSVDFSHGEITHSLELILNSVPPAQMLTFDILLMKPTGGGKLGTKIRSTVAVFGEEDTGYVSFAQPRFDALASTGMVTLLVSRKNNLDSAAFVMYETTDGSAISGTHYRGGTNSIVFEAKEAAKEVGIPIYNDPRSSRQPLTFSVTLKSTPVGPKIGEYGSAQVSITCTEIAPVQQVKAAAPTGQCTVELLKPKYIVRRSAKTVNIPVHKSSGEGDCIVEWAAVPKGTHGFNQELQFSDEILSGFSSQIDGRSQMQAMGKINIPDGFDHGSIVLDVCEMDVSEPQVSLDLVLQNVYWIDESNMDDIDLGKKNAEVVVLNDIDPGTLGFSKATYSFKSNEGIVSLPVHRLGGMDGNVEVEWYTIDGSALSNQDFVGEHGALAFGNNEIVKHVEIQLLPGFFEEDEAEKEFFIELGRATGGAKTGTRRATVKILGGEDLSVVQFSKSSYPVIGTSTSIRIPILRTGDCQEEVIVNWYTEDETAKQGIDYKLCKDIVLFPVNSTRADIEVPLSGLTMDPRTFKVHLDTEGCENVKLGQNNVATIAIISNREPGTFEFSKPSYVFKTTSMDCGLIPVVRSNGTDGIVRLPWRIESPPGGEESPFEGAEGHLLYEDGQISASVEIRLHGVPSTSFVLVLLQPKDGGKLGAASKTVISIIGEADEPTIQMASPTLYMQSAEVIRGTVVRQGNTNDMTCVGWRTEDGTIQNGVHFVGGTGNLVFGPGETSKDILIPILKAPTTGIGVFNIAITEIMGPGQIGDISSMEVTLEPVENKIVEVQQTAARAEPETYVEFLRKRHHFAQSQGSALVPVHRSDTDGTLVLRYETATISSKAAKGATSPRRDRYASYSSDEEEEYGQQVYNPDDIDWGEGIVQFDDGERESAIELILYRDFPGRDANFKIYLIDPCDKVNFGVRETVITVLKDRDAGALGFAKPMYEFSCNDKQLLIPVHRSSGADGTVSVPWFTRDGSAVGGMHYIPDDGNLVFRDGEVVQKIMVPMPMKAHIFEEDSAAFDIVLGEPTGGASLQNHEAKVLLKNDIVPSSIEFKEPYLECNQSEGTLTVPVVRRYGQTGKVVLPWRVVSAPGKQRSRYEGTNDVITFKDGEDAQAIHLPLPKGLQTTEQEYFIVELDNPKTGRASIGDERQCMVAVNNDINLGTFSLSSENYSFNQSEGWGCVTVIRTDGSEGEASLAWKIKSNSVTPTILNNKRGVVDFNPGQTTAKIEVPLPKDSENDQESYTLSLSPPSGRGKLGEPQQAEILLVNDVECSIGFPQPLFETKGDVDTFLLPVIREGPKGRPVTVCYQMIDDTAKDLQHFIGETGSIDFDAGEDSKSILIPILNDPTGDRVVFQVELHSIQGPGKLSANTEATVAIDNLAGPGIFVMATPEMDVNQSSGKALVTVMRTHGRKGQVELPWFVEQVQTSKTARKPSSYDTMEGKLTFEDGEGQKTLEIPLETAPQDDDTTIFDAVLMTPTGSGAALGDVTTTTVTVNNDVEGGTLEMATEKVEGMGTDKEVVVPVVRTGSTDHKCYVSWEAEDVSGVRGKHYRGGRGNLSFEPGEKSKKITIPILNDPSGGSTSFNVCLGDTKGGAKLGEKTKTEVVTNHVREHGEICFDEREVHFRQSQKTIQLKLIRKTGTTGRVVVPWSIQDASYGSPYQGLKGQEKFNDGDKESHIEIDLPSSPQEKGEETIKVVLGQPIGGAFLTGDCECSVNVENDVPYAHISFQDEVCEVKQSDKALTLPITRSKRTEGRVRVPWSTKTESDASYYNELTGIEVFNDGEKKSHLEIKLSKVPTDVEKETFQVVLNQPKSHDAKLGDIKACTVVVLNDIELPLISFEDTYQNALQSQTRTYVTIKRLQHPTGRVIVPWKLVPESSDSPYSGIVGETVLEDGESEGVAEIHLPPVPLDDPLETVTVMLEDPIGGKLTDEAACQLTVTNDVGEGIVEMKSPNLTCSSDDGQAQVMVVRKLYQDFPAEIKYTTIDDDAEAGLHYQATTGELKFRPGEHERPIPINLMNDPTGETRHFKVKLTDLEGRDKLGDMDECRVTITNEATPPPPVPGFTADLIGPQSVQAKWLPVENMSVDGYKLSYWSRPGTSKTLTLGPEDTDVTLEPLEPNTTYQVLVSAFNDVGDGPASDKVIVETDPETRLSYDSPIQFKTSMHIARFTISRTQTKFKSTYDCVVTEEKRKKLSQSYETSSSSSSSSSDEDCEKVTPYMTSELIFEPGQSSITVEVPMEQNMTKMSKVYYVRVYDQKKKEKAIANLELQVINDTGVPGHVRTPFCASMTPKECKVTWEPPVGGGPVSGYLVTAKSHGLPDVTEDVTDGSTKTVLTNLQPSTKYQVTVQPYNKVGKGKRSHPADTTTQDEMKVEFAERFYTFKMSDKVAVIPIKRHFAHGYATLKWQTQWSKTQEEPESSSSSEDESDSRNRTWASGAVTFSDGQNVANVQIPLKEAKSQSTKKRSFFWLYITDPNRRKRVGAMKCGLINDKARVTAPKEIICEAEGPDSIIVSWNPENVSAQEYWVGYKRAGSMDEASTRRTVRPDAGQFIISDLKPESTYAIVVTAIGEGGQQASTEVLSCTTTGNVPGPPNRIVFQVLSPTSLQCSWGEPAVPNGVITSYEVMYEILDDSDADPPILIQIPDGHYRSLLVEELKENKPYKYSVRAINKWGHGPFRDAQMKIEHVGARPPSAIFVDAHDLTYLQQQQRYLEEQQQQREMQQPRLQKRLDHEVKVSQRQIDPTEQTTSTQMTKTIVTRYIHKEGQAEPVKETLEFEGRLSQEELQNMAREGERLEVKVLTYNTTQKMQTGGMMQSYQESGTEPLMQQIVEDPEFRSDSRREVYTDVQEFTDVQESRDGDADVTTITKTYTTTTTERQLDTRSGVRRVVYSPTQITKK